MFDLSLNLESMKKSIGWSDAGFEEFYLQSKPRGVYYRLRHDKRNILPCRTTYTCELTNPGGSNAESILVDYYKTFLNYVLAMNDEKFEITPYRMLLVLEEALVNTIKHGSGEQAGKFLSIENYHPLDPSKMILRISNPHAVKWDYESGVRNKMWEKKGEVTKHGTVLLNNMNGLTASYEDDGRDFLALLDITNLRLGSEKSSAEK